MLEMMCNLDVLIFDNILKSIHGKIQAKILEFSTGFLSHLYFWTALKTALTSSIQPPTHQNQLCGQPTISRQNFVNTISKPCLKFYLF
jgi:hypothetical protein